MGHASTFTPARSILTSFSAQAMLERRPKRFSKPQLAKVRVSIPPQKKRCTAARGQVFQKQIHVFKYAGSSPGKVFLNSPKNYEMSGLLPSISVNDSEETVREEIAELIQSKGGRFTECDKHDFEFIRVSRRTAQVPATKTGFQWTGSAVKGLAGLGAVYVRLTKNFAGNSTNISSGDAPSTSGTANRTLTTAERERIDDSDSSDFEESPRLASRESRKHHHLEDHPHSDSTVPVSGTSRAPADFVSSDSESTSVDVLEEDAVIHTSRQEVPIEQSVDNRKITFSPPSTSFDIHQPTEEQQQQLVAMFPEHPSSTISTVLELTQGDMQRAADMILSPPTLAALLQKLRDKISYKRVQLIVDEDDELEMFHSVIGYYKVPNFDPTLDMRVRFQGQPAVDTGGPRRQMFTSVFATFATSTDLNLFEHDGQFLRPRYSVQNVMSNLMVILGKMIAHALALEGLGFPYLSCCNYWYIATGDQTQALQYAGFDDVGPHVRELLVQVNFSTANPQVGCLV